VVDETERFQKHQRLNKPSEFSSVFGKNERSADSCFLVLARQNGLGYSRLGLAVSRQKLRKAVDRNRIKRLIRESFRKNQQILAGLDLVVLPQKHIEKSGNRSLQESLNIHWRRVSRCKES